MPTTRSRGRGRSGRQTGNMESGATEQRQKETVQGLEASRQSLLPTTTASDSVQNDQTNQIDMTETTDNSEQRGQTAKNAAGADTSINRQPSEVENPNAKEAKKRRQHHNSQGFRAKYSESDETDWPCGNP